MKRLISFLLAFFLINTIYSEDSKVNIHCVDSSSEIKVWEGNTSGSPVKTFLGNGFYDYNHNISDTLIIRMTLKDPVHDGEYIQKRYAKKSGVENDICMSLANVDGFYQTDRDQLNKITKEILDKLQRKSGMLREIEVWLQKAIKDVQTNPSLK
jgi:hypothetical protein